VVHVLKWIGKNKEWLFSGIGVAAFLAAIKFISFDWLAIHWQEILFICACIVVAGFAMYGFIHFFETYVLSKLAAKPPSIPAIPSAPSIPSGQSPGPERITNITPEFICDEIHNAPLLQQEVTSARYHNLWVRWSGTLAHAWERSSEAGMVSLTLYRENQILTPVKAVVLKSAYPELLHLRQGAPIVVVGRIESANSSNVTLVDTQLSFPAQVTEEPTDAEISDSVQAADHPDLPKEQIKILKSLALHEDLVEDKPVSMADLQKRCDLTTTEFKHHSEELRKAKLIYVTHPHGIPHYQNSPAGAGWLINTKQKY
jgi:hypothetical protein